MGAKGRSKATESEDPQINWFLDPTRHMWIPHSAFDSPPFTPRPCLVTCVFSS